MMRLIIFAIVAGLVWFAYTNLGKPANLDSTIQNGTAKIKTEKTIDKVGTRRQGMVDEAHEVTSNY